MRARMHWSLCCVQCFKLHRLCCCGIGGKAQASCVPQWLEGQCPRPHCHCCPVTCGHRCTHNCSLEARVVHTTCPAIAALSGEPGLWVPAPLFPWPRLLCLFQSTHLQMYGYVELLGILVRLVEAPLSSCGCSTGCIMRGDTVSFCHAAVVTRLHLLMAKWQDHLA